MTLFSRRFHNVDVFLIKLQCVKWLWFIFLNPLLYGQIQSVSVLLLLGHREQDGETYKKVTWMTWYFFRHSYKTAHILY